MSEEIVNPEKNVVEPAITDTHTAENTTFKNHQEPQSPIIKEEDYDSFVKKGFVSFKVGVNKKSIEENGELVEAWLALLGAQEGLDNGEIPLSTYEKIKANWEEICETKCPDKDPEEVAENIRENIEFSTSLLDPLLIRSRLIREEGISNVSSRGRGGIVTPDIVGKRPKAKQGSSVAEMMIRSSLANNKDKLNFDVLLRDSFTMLTFTRPSNLEIGVLMQEIADTVKGYVRNIRNSSVSMARIAVTKVIWKFLASRIVYSSVSDIPSMEALSNVIRYKDIERLTLALIESFNTRGVNLGLRCYSMDCDWTQYAVVDPTKLALNRATPTDEEYAIYANLINQRVKYTMDETLALSNDTKFNLKEEDFRIYNEDQSIYLVLRQPTLAQAFNTFDNFIAKINPKIQQLRREIIDPEEFEHQISLLYSTIGTTEFIHWIQEYHTVVAPGEDGEAIVLKREDNEAEFDKGLMTIIENDEHLSKELVRAVNTRVPTMTHSFVGLHNGLCPSCKQHQGDIQNKQLGVNLGYTPIDPIMSFFTLTQLKQVMTLQNAREKERSVLSNWEQNEVEK